MYNPHPTPESYLALSAWCMCPNPIFLFPRVPLHYMRPWSEEEDFTDANKGQLPIVLACICICMWSCILTAERPCVIFGWLVKRAANAWVSQCSLSHFSNRCLPSFQAITRANTQHLYGNLHHTLLIQGNRGQEPLPACTGWNHKTLETIKRVNTFGTVPTNTYGRKKRNKHS